MSNSSRGSSSSPAPSSSDFEPPPIPPPDYTKTTTQEWSQRHMPPLKGAILDKDFLPNEEEAARAIARLQGKDSTSLSSQQSTPRPSPSSSPSSTPSTSQQPGTAPDLYRKSGTSDILGRAASAPTNEPINLMPGGTRHSAGGERMEVTTWTDALATIKPESFGAALAVPCIRQALTFGMVCGFFGAGAAWVSGRPALRVANMAVMTFLGTSPLSFGYCDWERRRERKTVRVVKEAWDAKREEKKLEWEKFREAKLREVQRDGKQKPTPQQKTSSSSWWRSSTGPKGREG